MNTAKPAAQAPAVTAIHEGRSAPAPRSTAHCAVPRWAASSLCAARPATGPAGLQAAQHACWAAAVLLLATAATVAAMRRM
jgi:hypothetical protein